MKHPYTNKAQAGNAGFSMVDVSVAMTLLMVAVGGLTASILSSRNLARANQETATANAALHQMAARLYEIPFEDIFASFNGVGGDDPNGLGTAPGNSFDVLGLAPQTSDADQRVGRIIFPTVAVGATEQLHENIQNTPLGMPRDLNGDGEADAGTDHAGDYLILPVTVRIEWRGPTGDRLLELSTLLTP